MFKTCILTTTKTLKYKYKSFFTANFRVFVLRKGGTIISAAALRPHGNLLAELPYIVTREGYRREGNCKRLLDAREMILYKGGVKWMALPAVGATVDIWVNNFGFKKARCVLYI